MHYGLEQFIDEAIQLELNASEIYSIFSEAIPEDTNFWATLAWEEKNHASVLKTGKEILIPIEQFPGEILPDVIQVLIETNAWLSSLRDKFSRIKPDRKTAFAIAIKIESSAGEFHFQRVMETPSASKAIKIFQELCEDDIHHLSRIREYMKGVEGVDDISESAPRSILIAIDDDSVAKLLKTILDSEGEVEIVRNGRAALEKVKEKYYDLVVSAIEMPIVDGIEFYKQAKEIFPDMNNRFLFFTGAPTTERISFFNDENLKYLPKPSTIDAIRTSALSILGERQ